jgi:hypothetical protein
LINKKSPTENNIISKHRRILSVDSVSKRKSAHKRYSSDNVEPRLNTRPDKFIHDGSAIGEDHTFVQSPPIEHQLGRMGNGRVKIPK